MSRTALQHACYAPWVRTDHQKFWRTNERVAGSPISYYGISACLTRFSVCPPPSSISHNLTHASSSSYPPAVLINLHLLLPTMSQRPTPLGRNDGQRLVIAIETGRDIPLCMASIGISPDGLKGPFEDDGADHVDRRFTCSDPSASLHAGKGRLWELARYPFVLYDAGPHGGVDV
jgi:hypothetical protein